MTEQFNVLVIDDDPQIRGALRNGLEQYSFSVTICQTGKQGLDAVATRMPDAIILGLAMPGTDGLEVCKEVREWSNVPIIILSDHNNEEDKISALELADDYVTKPFGMGELIARLRAVLRRTANQDNGDSTFSCTGLTIDYGKRLVRSEGKQVHLTPKEYDLLKYMSVNVNRVLTHRQLLTKIWGENFADDHHTLRVHVANLRNKIERHPKRPTLIRTEVGIGYRFSKSED